jgi:hypothetical protein
LNASRRNFCPAKASVNFDLLRLRDAADEFGKFTVFASGGQILELRHLFTQKRGTDSRPYRSRFGCDFAFQCCGGG